MLLLLLLLLHDTCSQFRRVYGNLYKFSSLTRLVEPKRLWLGVKFRKRRVTHTSSFVVSSKCTNKKEKVKEMKNGLADMGSGGKGCRYGCGYR